MLLADRAVFQGFVCLLLGRFQSLKFILRFLHSLSKQLVLLRQQLRVPRVQLQKFLHVLQLSLSVFDFFIDPLQGCL